MVEKHFYQLIGWEYIIGDDKFPGNRRSAGNEIVNERFYYSEEEKNMAYEKATTQLLHLVENDIIDDFCACGAITDHTVMVKPMRRKKVVVKDYLIEAMYTLSKES